jgi:RNA polymerase sigma factor (sigma-70 family)
MTNDDDAAMPAPTGSGTEDARLVAAYLGGDRSALGVIYDRHGGSLFDTAAAMTGNRDDAADMVQDVFVLAAERLGQLRDPSRLRPWLFAILRNEVYRRSRRRSRSVVTDFSAPEREVMMPSSPAESEQVDDEIDAAELAELVRGAARGLDARDQLVLELSVRQGLSGADLADALGVSAQQGYGLVHRMRERTERSLGAYCVARRGSRDCAELAGILTGWDGEFTVLLRKRVARHIEECSTCERTRRKVLPLALVGSAPAFAAPIGLRDRIMEQVLAMSSGQAPGGDAAGVDPSNGFPVLEGVTTAGRRLAVILGGIAATTLVVLGGLTIGRGDPVTDVTSPVEDPAPTTITEAAGPAVTSPTSTTGGPAVSAPVVDTTEAVPTTRPEAADESATTTSDAPVAVRPTGTTPATTAPATTAPAVAPPVATTTAVTTTTIPETTVARPATTTAPPTTAPPTTAPPTTLAPTAPVIDSATSGSGAVPLPSECTTDVYVTVEISDANDDEMALTLGWSATLGSPRSGSTVFEELTAGTHRLLLGTFDFSHRLATIFVTIDVTDPSGRVANRGFQLTTDSSGDGCPSIFG